MHKELMTAVKVLTCPKPCTVSKGFQDGNRQLWPKSQDLTRDTGEPLTVTGCVQDSTAITAALSVNCWHISSTKKLQMPMDKLDGYQ